MLSCENTKNKTTNLVESKMKPRLREIYFLDLHFKSYNILSKVFYFCDPKTSKINMCTKKNQKVLCLSCLLPVHKQLLRV